MVFPAGEVHFRRATPHNENTRLSHAIWQANPETLNDDLITLGLWVDTAHRLNQPVSLIMGYVPGARADRRLPLGAAYYAQLINSMAFEKVVILDPHSDVITGLLNNVVIDDRRPLIAKAIKNKGYTGLIAPDAGAIARTEALGSYLDMPVFYAEKRRDFHTGKLTGFTCEDLPEGGKYLIADDICDGGGTFMGLAEATGLARQQLGLWITHGVFSGHSDRLTEYYSEILTTNTMVSAEQAGFVTVVDAIGPMEQQLFTHAVRGGRR